MGNTVVPNYNRVVAAVHPHACGEHGSAGLRHPGKFRFIPTPVGNTSRHLRVYSLRSVHPHACGEHEFISNKENKKVGSSPRLWGTHRYFSGCRHYYRFIPTPVGNTRPPGCSRRSPPGFIPTPVGNTACVFCTLGHQTVHPHACGEHMRAIRTGPAIDGSSPRLWGTQRFHKHSFLSIRFIPTPVGNT